jgi:hypothetical protein|tara:strand:- start:354 stop:665 length:312 start_codon:yes stop_codon:yes gene_type:complete
MNMKLLKEVREIKRKVSLPIVRKGTRGEIVPVHFTERETNLLIEMLFRRSVKDPNKSPTHIFNPMKMHEERVKRGEGHNEKGQFHNSTQRKAMELIRKGKWVV